MMKSDDRIEVFHASVVSAVSRRSPFGGSTFLGDFSIHRFASNRIESFAL